jgi:hypothetical protein
MARTKATINIGFARSKVWDKAMLGLFKPAQPVISAPIMCLIAVLFTALPIWELI